FFFSSRRRHTRFSRDWSSDVCSSDLKAVDHFDNAIRLSPGKWQAYHFKGISIIKQKEYDKALEVFEDAITKFDDRPRFLVDSARSEERRVGKECRSWWSRYSSTNDNL